MRLFEQIKHDRKSIKPMKDIAAGIVVALVSIPISMGYAQIAGLPAVYGLYGSLFPILVYGLLSTSPQFVVGVDAMPAVMVGGLLAEFGIVAESEQAMKIVPLITLLTAAWFLLFFLFKAGRIVKYISTPVMGGFISGVGLTIILMQIPKMFGGVAGTGEVIDLVKHIISQTPNFHPLSAALGFGTFVIILVCKKFIPKVPMTIVMLAIGAILQVVFHLDQYGVKMLSEVESGMPDFLVPDFSLFPEYWQDLIFKSLSIAAVIMAQTLLATNNYAMKYNDKIDKNKELLAYSAMNVASAFTGSLPINGSVSRSGIADSMGARSQIMSITSFASMVLIVLFGTPYLKYLPVPILTGIVLTALWGILDFTMVKKLWKTSKNELIVFIIAFLGVMFFGTVYGVVIGVVLSFFDVSISAVAAPASFVGRIPGQGNFYALNRNKNARAIDGAIIYRFSGNLFFANIDNFQSEIEAAVKPNTRVIVIDARGIGNIDITAMDRLVILNKNFRKKGIKFYIAEHDGSLNDEIKKLGAEDLLKTGVVRRTITLALADAGLFKPYDLETIEEDGVSVKRINEKENVDSHMAEFEWLFGNDAEKVMEELAENAARQIISAEDIDNSLEGNELSKNFGKLAMPDEDDILDYLEIIFEKMHDSGRLSETEIEKMVKHIELRRIKIAEHLEKTNPSLLEKMHKHHEKHLRHLEHRNPEAFKKLMELKKKIK